jgi:hypothetical protein
VPRNVGREKEVRAARPSSTGRRHQVAANSAINSAKRLAAGQLELQERLCQLRSRLLALPAFDDEAFSQRAHDELLVDLLECVEQAVTTSLARAN